MEGSLSYTFKMLTIACFELARAMRSQIDIAKSKYTIVGEVNEYLLQEQIL